jgi:hypothetical protein
MTLHDWLRNSWLEEHQPSLRETSDLLAAAESDLCNAQVPRLSADWRMSIAYNAALRLTNVALAACGFRAARDAHHYRLIQSLELTISLDAGKVRQFEAFRKKRNISNYDRSGSVSTREAQEMLALAQFLQQAVVNWLRANHPDLLEA